MKLDYMILHVDLETYSDINLTKVGAYKYAHHESTEILMIGYALDDSEVKVAVNPQFGDFENANGDWGEVTELLQDGTLSFYAHNAQFEMAILGAKLKCLDENYWRCTQAIASSVSLPPGLEKLARALDLQDKKDGKGKRLMRKFSMPVKPTKKHNAVRYFPGDDTEDFNLYIDYCAQDVRTERAVHKRLEDFELSDAEQEVWRLDCRINSRGIPVDLGTVTKALELVTSYAKDGAAKVVEMTGLNYTQTAKLIVWCAQKGVVLESFAKEYLKEVLKDINLNPEVRKMLEIRRDINLTSLKKLPTMVNAACKDGRIRGTLRYYGALTGRWSGRLLQPQNFKRCGLKDVDREIKYINSLAVRDYLWMVDDAASTVSQLLRSMICTSKDKKIMVADYSSIEARLLAWLAGQKDLVEKFKAGEDVYVDMASYIYKVAADKVTKSQRQIGKVVVLGCGYGMGADKFYATCKSWGIDIDEDFARICVQSFRTKNREIVNFWSLIEQMATHTIRHNQAVQKGYITCSMRDIFLQIGLPSGRFLSYPFASLQDADTKWGIKEQITYSTYKTANAYSEKTYGGKLVENITQAVARDLLVSGMHNAENKGYKIIATIHDEILCEVGKDFGREDELKSLLCDVPVWARGCPMDIGDISSNRRYSK